jgi:hypothetical protein
VRKKELALERKAFDDWRRSVGVSVAIEGWFPSADGGPTPAQRGRWLELKGDAAQTADVTSGEQVYPLLALVPDPRDAAHDAAGRTLYFGVVPTQDLQHDDRGDPHFDDRSTFELRCFVRAHHDCPPKRGKKPDCGGALAWSRPSEAFRVAAPFDLIGTSNRPVTIKMPDLRDLAAQAATRPRGKFSPVRFVQPQHMSPGGMGGFSICSFSIPLITIVALFVLNLFLPIVVFLFQLWFLLVFRFCIPPQVKMDAGVDAALAVTPPGVDLAIDGAVSIDNLPVDADDLQALLATSVDKGLAMDKAAVAASGYDLPSVDLSKQSSNSLGPIDQSFTDAASLEDDDPPPDVGEPLAYEDPVVSVRPVARNGA